MKSAARDEQRVIRRAGIRAQHGGDRQLFHPAIREAQDQGKVTDLIDSCSGSILARVARLEEGGKDAFIGKLAVARKAEYGLLPRWEAIQRRIVGIGHAGPRALDPQTVHFLTAVKMKAVYLEFVRAFTLQHLRIVDSGLGDGACAVGESVSAPVSFLA